jgi:hypothetical protein
LGEFSPNLVTLLPEEKLTSSLDKPLIQKHNKLQTSLEIDFSNAGLPDGLFSNQKSQFGEILEDLRMESAGIFFGHLEYFTVIWYI